MRFDLPVKEITLLSHTQRDDTQEGPAQVEEKGKTAEFLSFLLIRI